MALRNATDLQHADIVGARIVPVSAHRDERGCLVEIFRESWAGAFHAVQWNACVSERGVVRGAHVHIDYDEFYALPRGRVIIGLADIRRSSPTFGASVQFTWSEDDAVAVVVPKGVVHVVLFEAHSVLTYGLSSYWTSELEVGCQWDAPELGFDWPAAPVRRSARDTQAGTYAAMCAHYEALVASPHGA